jgi:NAD(P)H-nitrite reductase large subunit
LNLKFDFKFAIFGATTMATHAPSREAHVAPVPPAMTRCECSGVSFQEVARRMEADRSTLDEVCRRTRCGHTCTACLPDLARFVAARQK